MGASIFGLKQRHKSSSHRKVIENKKTTTKECHSNSSYIPNPVYNNNNNIKFNFDTLKSPNSYSLRKFLQSMVSPYFFSQTSPTQNWQGKIEATESFTAVNPTNAIVKRSASGIIRPARLTLENKCLTDTNLLNNNNRWLRKVPRSEDSSGLFSDTFIRLF
jgi:hypothetical protein